MVNVDWAAAGIGWVDPNIPNTSMLVILSILGAVIMPHNLFCTLKSSKVASSIHKIQR